MKTAIHSLGIIAFKSTPPVREVLKRIHSWSHHNAISVVYHPGLRDIGPPGCCIADSEEKLLKESDGLVSVGGDGTFLSALHLCRFVPRPVIGINVGGLGFLTDIGPDRVELNLQRVIDGDYKTISRMILKVHLKKAGKTDIIYHALNDVFVNRLETPKLVSLGVWHGTDYITDFQGDGVIVATPSGSTAYSLAAGGPIVEPGIEALLLTPVCPHSLTERPLIVSADYPLRIVIRPDQAQVLVSVDGLHSDIMSPGDEILVCHDGNQTNLIQLSSRSHYDLLRQKLGWGYNLKQRNGSDDAAAVEHSEPRAH